MQVQFGVLGVQLVPYLEVGEELLVLAEGVRPRTARKTGLQRKVQCEGGELWAVVWGGAEVGGDCNHYQLK